MGRCSFSNFVSMKMQVFSQKLVDKTSYWWKLMKINGQQNLMMKIVKSGGIADWKMMQQWNWQIIFHIFCETLKDTAILTWYSLHWWHIEFSTRKTQKSDPSWVWDQFVENCMIVSSARGQIMSLVADRRRKFSVIGNNNNVHWSKTINL